MLGSKIAPNLARRRYLEELRSWERKSDEERICVICQATFDVGSLTKCGHLFCVNCLQIWLRNHRTCPVCKERVTDRDWHKIATQNSSVHIKGTVSVPHDHKASEAIYRS
jgi:E3 ubiquitin-protein ligase SHPRH